MDAAKTQRISENIPIFKGLDVIEFEKILAASKKKTFQKGEYLFRAEEATTEMYIILSGRLAVKTRSGMELAMVHKMGVVGEMGVLTGHPRSAGVLATEPTITLSITREALLDLIETDRDIGYKLYRNAIHILCDRLRANNIHLENQNLLSFGFGN